MTQQLPQTKATTQTKRHVLAVYVEDLGDALRRVTSVVCRRGCKLESLSTSPTENEAVSRVMIIVEADHRSSTLLIHSLGKLHNVLRVEDVTVSRPPTQIPVEAEWIGGP